jgi:hypothetical protein
MAIDRDLDGWTWFETAVVATEDPEEQELRRAFARCFSSADGRLVMETLERLMLNRRLSPNASNGELRHLEGQRFAVAYIATMAARGRASTS